MFHPRRNTALLLTLLCTTPALFAQRGCFHSPEAPTSVLLLIGTTGMLYGSHLARTWLARRR